MASARLPMFSFTVSRQTESFLGPLVRLLFWHVSPGQVNRR